MFFVLLLIVMSHVSDWWVHQFEWWPTNWNEVEISFGEVQSLCEGTGTLCVKRVGITSKTCVQILLYCHIDTTFHEDEAWYQRDSSELLIGWPRGGETACFPCSSFKRSTRWLSKKSKCFAVSCFMGLVILLWRNMCFVTNHIPFVFLTYIIYYRNIKTYCKVNSFILILNCSINCFFLMSFVALYLTGKNVN